MNVLVVSSRRVLASVQVKSILQKRSFPRVGYSSFISTRATPVVRYFSTTDDRRKGIDKTDERDDEKDQDMWAWIPPKRSADASLPGTALEIKKKVPLTKEEVRDYLVANGAENVIVLQLRPEPLGTLSHFVIGTCQSTRLVRQFCMTIAKNLKDRELKWMIGYTGPEGDPSDDWQCVDCDSFAVHLFTEAGREVYDLESWWSMDERPVLNPNLPPDEYRKQWETLIEQYPPTGKSGRTANITYIPPEGDEGFTNFDEIKVKYEKEMQRQSHHHHQSSTSHHAQKSSIDSKIGKEKIGSRPKKDSSEEKISRIRPENHIKVL